MGNPNCCFMIIPGTFFSPANRRGELCSIHVTDFHGDEAKKNFFFENKFKMADTKKNLKDFQNRQFSIFFRKKFRDWSLG